MNLLLLNGRLLILTRLPVLAHSLMPTALELFVSMNDECESTVLLVLILLPVMAQVLFSMHDEYESAALLVTTLPVLTLALFWTSEECGLTVLPVPTLVLQMLSPPLLPMRTPLLLLMALVLSPMNEDFGSWAGRCP